MIREWFARAGVQMEPRVFHDLDEALIVEQDATWPGGEPQAIASLFQVQGGQITRIVRYPDLAAALAGAAPR